MAHVEKYKTAAVAGMVRHYERSGAARGRDNVDAALTKDNYTLGIDKDGRVRQFKMREGRGGREFVARVLEQVSAASGRKVRKDAVVLGDVVVTLPRDVPQADEKRFFAACTRYVAREVGAANVVGCYVHVDEPGARHHAHIAFVPVTEDGRLSYKTVCPRTFYQRLHKGLGDQCERDLGYRPEIELSAAKKGQKQLSRLSQEEYRAATTELERLRGEVASEQERLERLRCNRRAVAERVEALESVVAECRAADASRLASIGSCWRRVARAASRGIKGLSQLAMTGPGYTARCAVDMKFRQVQKAFVVRAMRGKSKGGDVQQTSHARDIAKTNRGIERR